MPLKEILPQLATLAAVPPVGKEWVHELKVDGYRIIAYLEKKKVRLITRNGKDLSGKLPQLASSIARLPVRSAILDGELAAIDKDGKTSFQELQNFIRFNESVGNLAYICFDLLYHDGIDLRSQTLIERKRILEKLIGRKRALKGVVYLDHHCGDGRPVLEEACLTRAEGIVSKKAMSLYISGRSRSWLKIKCENRQEFVICGYTLERDNVGLLGALLLGDYSGNILRYAGKVGTGFTAAEREQLIVLLKKISTKQSPFGVAPRIPGKMIWTKPVYLCEIRFREWTRDGFLRQPSFIGLRTDKKPRDVQRETPIENV